MRVNWELRDIYPGHLNLVDCANCLLSQVGLPGSAAAAETDRGHSTNGQTVEADTSEQALKTVVLQALSRL